MLALDAAVLVRWRPRFRVGRRSMFPRLHLCLLVLALVASDSALAQNPVRTETIKPPAAATTEQGRPTGHLAPSGAVPEIVMDLAGLPAPVARTRERLLGAARSGDLGKLAELIGPTRPCSRSRTTRPVAF